MRAPRTETRPACSAGVSASASMPERAAARITAPRRPLSSAATSRSSRCVAAGSRRTRSRNRRSTSRVSGRASGSGSAPASCAAESAPGSSTSASGLPPACSTSSVAHRRRDVAVDRAGEQRRGRFRVETARARARRARAPRSGGRRPRARRTASRSPSASSRRATNSSASADGGSSHWASSTRHSTGRRSASSASSVRQAARDQEAVVAGALGRARARPARARGLRRRQPVEQVQRRAQELVQPGERQLGLGLDAARARARACRPPARARPRAAPSCRRPASPRSTSAPLRDARAASSSAPMRGALGIAPVRARGDPRAADGRAMTIRRRDQATSRLETSERRHARPRWDAIRPTCSEGAVTDDQSIRHYARRWKTLAVLSLSLLDHRARQHDPERRAAEPAGGVRRIDARRCSGSSTPICSCSPACC